LVQQLESISRLIGGEENRSGGGIVGVVWVGSQDPGVLAQLRAICDEGPSEGGVCRSLNGKGALLEVRATILATHSSLEIERGRDDHAAEGYEERWEESDGEHSEDDG